MIPEVVERRARWVLDSIGATPLVIAIGDDGRSVRAFDRRVDGRTLTFFRKTDAAVFTLLDAESGSTWDFRGVATAGPLTGRALARIDVLSDYWFDWQAYHPSTQLYAIGAR